MNNNRIEIIKKAKYSIDKGDFVLYWMQQSMRVNYNHALNYAIERANEVNLPVLVFFSIDSSFPDINIRNLSFMVEGLKEIEIELKKRGINFIIEVGQAVKLVEKYLSSTKLLVVDKGYLRYQRHIRKQCFDLIINKYEDIRVVMIDTDVIVPVSVASQKIEYGAYTIRPKLTKMYLDYLDFICIKQVDNKSELNFGKTDLDSLLSNIKIDSTISKSNVYKGGYEEAKSLLTQFIDEKINNYLDSNNPGEDLTSKMSMYLHFGQISSLEILEIILDGLKNNKIVHDAGKSFIEQLLVRRELAYNYVTYNLNYDQFYKISEPWAYKTLDEHLHDKREYLYTINDLITFKTHDIYFNTAMKEMVVTGYMHNYMRMYWAKKIIEWSPSYNEAYENIVFLNNKYFIDGRDANSYAGIAWCFGKHDRPWREREIFGKLRYMNDKGLERKFDMDLYIKRVDKLIK